jgi:hypothetical protein
MAMATASLEGWLKVLATLKRRHYLRATFGSEIWIFVLLAFMFFAVFCGLEERVVGKL